MGQKKFAPTWKGLKFHQKTLKAKAPLGQGDTGPMKKNSQERTDTKKGVGAGWATKGVYVQKGDGSSQQLCQMRPTML